jgi:hypothetical protein
MKRKIKLQVVNEMDINMIRKFFTCEIDKYLGSESESQEIYNGMTSFIEV